MSITPPIRLRQLGESIAIEDGAGVGIAYVYFEDDQTRRILTKRLTKVEAQEAAKIMASAIRSSIAVPE
jgi:hypothetical protein